MEFFFLAENCVRGMRGLGGGEQNSRPAPAEAEAGGVIRQGGEIGALAWLFFLCSSDSAKLGAAEEKKIQIGHKLRGERRVKKFIFCNLEARSVEKEEEVEV